MIESYYHIISPNDRDFYERTVSLKDFNGKKYKKLVSKESIFHHRPIDVKDIKKIMKMNFLKAEHICESDFSEEIDHKLILDKELEIKNKKEELYVLNTLSLLPIDYNKDKFKHLLASKYN